MIILPERPKKEDFASIDFETRGVRKLKLVGSHKYFEDPHNAINCMGWSINYEPVEMWLPWQPFPKALRRHIERGGKMHAWHAMFERLCWSRHLQAIVEVQRRQFRCTMVRALACGFPGKLEHSAKALRIPERKDTEGAKAMVKLSKPRNQKKALEGEEPIWWDREEYASTYRTMYAYCRQDVVTERACGKALPYLPDSEEWQYYFDQIVADRGVRIDQDLARKAIQIINTRQVEVKEESKALCGFVPSQPVPMRHWINKHGKMNLLDLKKEQVDSALRKKDLPPKVRRVLTLRKEGARSATAKFKSSLDHICNDGTVKGLRQFYGGHTGRWAGRNPSFDNLKRVDKDINLEDMVSVIKTGESWLVESVYDSVLEPISNATRSMIIADDDSDLYVCDLKSIESRVLADLSGQKSTNDTWRLSDAGEGADVYEANAAEWFNIKLDKVEKVHRNWGKIGELLLGFEGGTAPLLRGQLKNNLYFRDIYEVMYKTADAQMREKVNFLWRKMGTGHEKDWRAARFVVEKWRRKNPMTVKFWKQMRIQSIKCVDEKKDTTYRGIRFHYNAQFKMLECHTGTGRCLYYPFARVVTARNRKGEPEKQLRASYQKKMPNGGSKFVQYNPYGGFITENITQHRARDVMAGRFRFLEKRGFKLLHTVHDENISQAKKILRLTLGDYIETVAVPPSWSPTLPVAVEAWTGPRYKKSE
jgi:hypothetical protein